MVKKTARNKKVRKSKKTKQDPAFARLLKQLKLDGVEEE